MPVKSLQELVDYARTRSPFYARAYRDVPQRISHITELPILDHTAFWAANTWTSTRTRGATARRTRCCATLGPRSTPSLTPLTPWTPGMPAVGSVRARRDGCAATGLRTSRARPCC